MEFLYRFNFAKRLQAFNKFIQVFFGIRIFQPEEDMMRKLLLAVIFFSAENLFAPAVKTAALAINVRRVCFFIIFKLRPEYRTFSLIVQHKDDKRKIARLETDVTYIVISS